MHTSLAAQKQKNIMKTWALMTAFFLVVMALGFFASQATGNPSFLYVSVLFSVGMNLYAYWFSDSVAIRSSGAIPADEVTYKDLHALVTRLAQSMHIPKPKVFIINDDAPNAFATGRNPQHASVAATTGILLRLSPSELEGVMAHELSHVQNRDILVMTIAVVLAGFVSLLANMFMRMSYSGGQSGDRQQSGLIGIIGMIVAFIVAPLAAQLLQLAVSRKREYLADASGALITHHPEHLASALEKIRDYSQPMENASYATAHLFISNPFGAHPAGKFLSGLFATHPPLEDRIAILRTIKN